MPASEFPQRGHELLFPHGERGEAAPGKLAAAARHWAAWRDQQPRDLAIDDDEREAQRDLGVPEQVIEEQEVEDEDPADKYFRVWPENWDSVQVFWRCTNSFDIGVGMTKIIYLGIKNSEIDVALRLMKIHEDKQLGILDDVSYMAGIAVREMNRE